MPLSLEIKIECGDIKDLKLHFAMISQQVQQALKYDVDLSDPLSFENEYGRHEVKVRIS